jgi:hypothetical protein
MSYFGTSGPPSRIAHSIAAGYQRRANQLQARSTSNYNVGVNLGSVKDRINDGYNKRFTKPYGQPQVLQNKVAKWVKHTEDNVETATTRLATFRKNKVDHQTELKILDDNHAIVKAQLMLQAEGRYQEMNITQINIANEAIKTIGDFKTYTPFNYSTLRNKKRRQISYVKTNEDNKDWGVLTLPDNKYEDPNSDTGKILLAEEALRTVHDITDKVYMKDVEDFMVDGRLMRESKAAVIVTPTTALLTLLGVGVLYYNFFQPSKTPSFRGGNKSAAMAVFK